MVVSTLLVAGSGYIINDYFDVKIDRINKPDEVIVGNTIKRRTALLFHQILSGVALILAFFWDGKPWLSMFFRLQHYGSMHRF